MCTEDQEHRAAGEHNFGPRVHMYIMGVEKLCSNLQSRQL